MILIALDKLEELGYEPYHVPNSYEELTFLTPPDPVALTKSEAGFLKCKKALYHDSETGRLMINGGVNTAYRNRLESKIERKILSHITGQDITCEDLIRTMRAKPLAKLNYGIYYTEVLRDPDGTLFYMDSDEHTWELRESEIQDLERILEKAGDRAEIFRY